MSPAVYAIVAVLLICTVVVESANECTINIRKHLIHEHPVILNLNDKFALPNTNHGLTLSSGQKLKLVCCGKKNSFQMFKGTQEIEAQCVNETTFKVNNGNVEFLSLSCATTPKATARPTGGKCLNNHLEIEIGFTTKSSFVRQITVCFDNKKKDALYSTYVLTPNILQQQIRPPRIKFVHGGFYNDRELLPSNLYYRDSQRNAFSKLLKSEQLAIKYITNDNDFFLARGHLTAKADFIYTSQQLATYFYVNAAPQWQIFNRGNWKKLEQSCRNYASERKVELQVYSGTHGVLTLPNLNRKETGMYMFISKENMFVAKENLITVPLVYWKVMYDPASKAGIAFVGHNNVYDPNIAKKRICTDVCGQVNWLLWQQYNVTAGYSYCCKVSELKKIVKNIPNLSVTKLLT